MLTFLQFCIFFCTSSYISDIFLHFYVFLTLFLVSYLYCDFMSLSPNFFFYSKIFSSCKWSLFNSIFWGQTIYVNWFLTPSISISCVEAESFVFDLHSRLCEFVYSFVYLQQQPLWSENLNLWPPIKKKSRQSLNWVNSTTMPVTSSHCWSSHWIQLGICKTYRMPPASRRPTCSMLIKTSSTFAYHSP